ncbi:MAG: Holliday junction resolvase RuvX [Gammaproteobacteria bacterium]|jgi:putative Holliday junction resolvase|nr:Holliday junction resolvase RuvX [Gammaproteobacteria bacterium]
MHKHTLLLGIDFGINTWGIAIGNLLTKTATEHTALKVRNGQATLGQIQELIQKWHFDAVVIGLPLNMDGTDQPLTKKVRSSARWLELKTGLPVYFQDERLSTIEAKARLFDVGGYRALKKEKIDSLSAKLILEDWLNSPQ